MRDRFNWSRLVRPEVVVPFIVCVFARYAHIGLAARTRKLLDRFNIYIACIEARIHSAATLSAAV
jgi:hypothetical protein